MEPYWTANSWGHIIPFPLYLRANRARKSANPEWCPEPATVVGSRDPVVATHTLRRRHRCGCCGHPGETCARPRVGSQASLHHVVPGDHVERVAGWAVARARGHDHHCDGCGVLLV